ncbi:hypothetical protein VHEMI03542 [[Torrubiella] hemipterigena]|uniref:CUE domain-containing protein n=1 Tax=[Torrubiella] hemipterigena TaxID=1531966 RepID=A0A0A1TDQ2_9HYPO|nr:hypothetical protein VHEMI03542 [[Torrubiella] hemipterigena]
MADDQVPVTYFLAIIVLAIFAFRYFLSSPAATTEQQIAAARRGQAANTRARELAALQIQQMLPQADTRTIMWNLQRQGGDSTRVIDLILAGRLEAPPITFQPVLQSTQQSTPAASRQPGKPSQPDLITRYNLKDKLESETDAAAPKGKAWSSSREEREASLQRRRDEMVLAARKKMEAKLAAQKAAKQA